MPNTLIVSTTDRRVIARLPLTDQNRDGIKAAFCCQMEQRNTNGDEYWIAVAPWGNSPQGKKAGAEYARKYGTDALAALVGKKRTRKKAA